jgi:hypothetical protein
MKLDLFFSSSRREGKGERNELTKWWTLVLVPELNAKTKKREVSECIRATDQRRVEKRRSALYEITGKWECTLRPASTLSFLGRRQQKK